MKSAAAKTAASKRAAAEAAEAAKVASTGVENLEAPHDVVEVAEQPVGVLVPEASAIVELPAVPVVKPRAAKKTQPRAVAAHAAVASAETVQATDADRVVEIVDEPSESPTSVEVASAAPESEPETPSEPEGEVQPAAAVQESILDSDDAEPAVATVAAPSDDIAPEQAGPDALRVRGLVKNFGDHRAVGGIDLTVPAGSFYGIVGPNGAGKTTTLSIIAGLLRPDAGTVHVAGIDQRADPTAAKRVMGVLPDRLRTFDRLTGRQLLHYYGLLRGLAPDVIDKRAADLARAFDLGDALGRVVSDYSAGMTKKIMLAGAMIHSPRVLVLDEPFEAVDPVSSGVILDILRAYVTHGGTVILSSHGMDLVERVCSRVAVIVSGDVLAEGTVDEVRAGQTLEARFVELTGSSGEVEGLEWLHTFSD